MAQFRNYQALADLVDRNEGVITCDMGSLRDAHGAGKLGTTVVANISEELDGRGLGHIPPQLPVYQDEKVRIYKKSSSVGKIIDAVEHIDRKHDDYLRRLSKGDSEKTLKKIRELVCE
jgi:hypothetical protein